MPGRSRRIRPPLLPLVPTPLLLQLLLPLLCMELLPLLLLQLLARLLLLLANFGKEGRAEPIIAKISQETLAEMIGTTRSRSLQVP